MIGNYEPALTWGLQSLALMDDYLQLDIVMAAVYAQLDRATEGRRHVEAVLAERPDFSATKHRSRLLYARDDDRDHMVEALLKAGFPE
jgi:hypothetical protein